VSPFLIGIILIAIGLVIAFFGRKYFWIFAALVGLAAGFAIVQALVGATSVIFALAVGIGLAIVLALTARSLAHVAVALIGFLMGAIIGSELCQPLGIDGTLLRLIVVVGGGVLGYLVLRYFFDIGVIVLSALAGAALVEDGLNRIWVSVPSFILWIITVVVLVGGIIYQWQTVKGTPEPQ
jgi:hypothetical protein